MDAKQSDLIPNERLELELNDIYDSYRTTYMNCKYYAARLTKVSKFNSIYEGVLAIGASSTIASWAIWKEPNASNAWAVFLGIISLLVVLKPFFRLSHKIEKFSTLHTGYRDLFYDLKKLVQDIKKKQILTEEMKAVLENAAKRYRDLAHEDEVNPNKKVLRRCFDEVKKEIPVSSLWYPKPNRLQISTSNNSEQKNESNDHR